MVRRSDGPGADEGSGARYLIPSEARDLAGEWLEPFADKVPRFARNEVNGAGYSG
jgi:hypothetical protein